MKKQEVRDSFIRRLTPYLAGFSARKRDGVFVRRFPGGRLEIGLALVDYHPEYRVSLVFSVRLEEAQTILHEVLETPQRYRNMTVTTVTPLDHFFPGERNKQFSVRSEEDIARVVDDLAPHLRDRIVPFFGGLQDVKSLEEVLNSAEGLSFDQTMAPSRQISALILARLAGNPRFDELAAGFEKQAEAWQPASRAMLLAVLRRLRG